MFKLYRLKNYNFRLIIWLLMISGIRVLLVGSAKRFPAVETADRCDPRSCGDGCCFFDGLQLAPEFLLDHLCVQHCDAVDRPFLSAIRRVVLPDGWILDLSVSSRFAFR